MESAVNVLLALLFIPKNKEEYEKLMNEEKEKSRQNQNFQSTKELTSAIKTEFLGYEKLSCSGTLKEIIKKESTLKRH